MPVYIYRAKDQSGNTVKGVAESTSQVQLFKKLSGSGYFICSIKQKDQNFFEKVSEEIDPILAAKWLRRELVRVLNYNKKQLHEIEMDEKHMIQLLKLVESKKITDNVASKILEKLIIKPFDVNEYIRKEGLEAVSDVGEIEKYCKEAIKENPKAVEDYKKGEAKALNFIVGTVMRKTKGKATPAEVNKILKKLVG